MQWRGVVVAYMALMLVGATVGLAASVAALTVGGLRTASAVFIVFTGLLALVAYALLRDPRGPESPRGARAMLRRAAMSLAGLGAATAAIAGAFALDRGDGGRGVTAVESPAAEIDVDPRSLAVERAPAPLGDPDPLDPLWERVAPSRITMIAQPMVAPRPAETRTESVDIQVVHDGERIAFRLAWEDLDVSEGGRLGESSDAFAIQFPVDGTRETPVAMGSVDKPVHIYHWRAQYQRDAERGKPTMRDLYPNIAMDMYPMDFAYAAGGSDEEQRQFFPGYAAGNPQAHPKDSIDEIISEGFATSAVIDGHSGAARAVWSDGEWALVIVRPLEVVGGSTIDVGGEHYIAFAAWQGGEGEVGSRKSITMTWLPIELKGGTPR